MRPVYVLLNLPRDTGAKSKNFAEVYMKVNKGLVMILVTFIITAVLWLTAVPRETVGALSHFGQLLGGLALNGLFLVFLLSLRNRRLDTWFGGLDKVYVYHKYLALLSVGLIFIHGQISESLAQAAQTAEQATGPVPAAGLANLPASMGSLGQALFIVLTLVALFGKRLKYENWRIFHRLLVIPYGLGIYHSYFSSAFDLFAWTPLAIWTTVTNAIGLGVALYMLFFYQRTAYRHKGRVSKIQRLNATTVELELILDQALDFQAGQFVFLKVFQQGLEAAPHPFSISGGQNQTLRLTIKRLGDFTAQLHDTIQVGTAVSLNGPYGQMDFAKGGSQQVWVAGGIGITPFMSYLQHLGHHGQSVQLYYTYRGEEEAVYRPVLERFAQENSQFQVVFNDSREKGRLDFAQLDLPAEAHYFMCGPGQLVKSAVKQVRTRYPQAQITFEAFDFRS